MIRLRLGAMPLEARERRLREGIEQHAARLQEFVVVTEKTVRFRQQVR